MATPDVSTGAPDPERAFTDGRAPRNLVICCDGTNNEFGENNTNVVRLVEVLERDPRKQRLYYDPGVGTMAEPGALGPVKKWMSKIAGLAFGAGLEWKAQEAYTYLMDFWEPGDRVYIFGFSRGSYTARVLAGMLHAIGLLPRGSYNLIPYAMQLYRTIRSERTQDEKQWSKLCDEFRKTFSRPMFEGDARRRFRVHFLGVWDTVSSVGWVWDPVKFPYTARNPSVTTIRHAVSIDERRWFFRQNLMKQAAQADPNDPAQSLVEVWFPGVHCDVGGGYPPELNGRPAELWRNPFTWMLAEAQEAKLLVDEGQLREVLGSPPPQAPRPWSDLAHESLQGAWIAAEFFPKQVWSAKTRTRRWEIGDFRHRTIPDGALIHETALLRMRDAALGYQPPNMSAEFRQQVSQLPSVPPALPYVSNQSDPDADPPSAPNRAVMIGSLCLVIVALFSAAKFLRKK